MTIEKRYGLCLIFMIAFMFFAHAQKFEQAGYATYYHSAFQGRYTSCGEIFDNAKYTAAHATLPFQTLVKITNLTNNKYVIVKINDRCPKYYNRIIDLSQAAARAIDIIAAGVASVKLEVVTESELNYVPCQDTIQHENDLPDSSTLKKKGIRSSKKINTLEKLNAGYIFSVNREAVIKRHHLLIEKENKQKEYRAFNKKENIF